MQKNFLRNLNFIIFLFFVLFAEVFQTTIFKYFPLNFFSPDFLLILAVYMGFKRDPLEGGLFIVLSSIFLEAHSSSARYYFLTGYVYTFVITKIISKILVIPNFFTMVLITTTLSFFWKTTLLILLSWGGHYENAIRNYLIFLFPGLIVNGIASVFFLQLFSKLDMMTYKDAHSEDEYDINREF